MQKIAMDGQLAKSATFTGASLDISAITGDFNVVIEVRGLAAGATARFHFEDSVDAFTNKVPAGMRGFIGSIDPAAPVRHTFRRRDLLGARFGTASAVLRCVLDSISSGTVTYESWVEV